MADWQEGIELAAAHIERRADAFRRIGNVTGDTFAGIFEELAAEIRRLEPTDHEAGR